MCSRQSVQLHAPWQGRALVWPQAATWPMRCNRKCAGQLLGNCWSPFKREHGASPLLPWMMLGEDVSLGASTATLYPSGGSTELPAEDRREEQKGGCAWVPHSPSPRTLRSCQPCPQTYCVWGIKMWDGKVELPQAVLGSLLLTAGPTVHPPALCGVHVAILQTRKQTQGEK